MIGMRNPQNAAALEAAAVAGRSLWDDARARLFRNKAAVAAMVVLGLFTACALILPLFWPHEYETLYRDRVGWSPTFEHLHIMGTDTLGRDQFIRLLVGYQVSLAVGVLATFVSLVIGVTWGTVAGYFGGRTDGIMMRIVDALYAIPFIFFVILLTTVFGRNIYLIFIAIGAVEWLTMSRIVRGQTLSLKNREFIEAARASGVSQGAIIARHIVPNIIGPVVVYMTLIIPQVILLESFLSFIGLGINEPLTSLGVLISNGKQQMSSSPWLLLFPAVVMAVTLLCLNFIGDGVRDAVDPKER
ncbi:ABC transporter permease subunit [Ponticaulis sp.]|uniref:ABC transporter permease n=1 Tax=Ponticaulis sp. TaxID=2020902 RepID=UPI000B676E00|nr:ABC transporter permease subunit [Ponticaulis sp.]MAJ08854.1 peptide ABC transporter permease [Ponticaulis sp.]RPG17544.1 MAG: ABC transporter permease subunit [Hyphomonadaceae bacterium TMED125]HBH91114.1 peptide ABC transporter permease [Hyphomonadaceae bacterium]HBJ92410.1 peptide ABC transporter permease [Hyphomonadaceae bacterium]|tara:strand:- start:12186 stop:13088 length:903 start_codon:yes stop_codon:yes gene_type:complete